MVLIISRQGIRRSTLLQRLEHEIEQKLADHDVRFTRGRRQVVHAIASADGPRTASELHAGLHSVPLSSLYRSLSVLVDAGVLAQHHGADEITRYELAEWLTEHHHHLVCVSCGSIIDVAASAAQEETVDRLVFALAGSSDFAVSGHRFEIEGRCARCR
jgi:Fur family ferric uptake transcriptional regulator